MSGGVKIDTIGHGNCPICGLPDTELLNGICSDCLDHKLEDETKKGPPPIRLRFKIRAGFVPGTHLKPVRYEDRKFPLYECRCGNQKQLDRWKVENRFIKSCGECQYSRRRRTVDITLGQKFHHLTVVQLDPYAEFQCECGQRIKLSPSLVTNGYRRSCGTCLRARPAKKCLRCTQKTQSGIELYKQRLCEECIVFVIEHPPGSIEVQCIICGEYNHGGVWCTKCYNIVCQMHKSIGGPTD